MRPSLLLHHRSRFYNFLFQPLERSHERDERGLFFTIQLRARHDIEELHGVFKGQQSAIVKIGRRIFDSAKHKRLDRTIRLRPKPLEFEIVHHVIGVCGWLVAACALGLAKEEFLSRNLLFRGFFTIEPGGHRIEFGRGREIDHILHLCHVGDLKSIDDIDPLFGRPNMVAIEIRGPSVQIP